MSVRRIFVEKKPEFAVLAHDLKEEIASYLGIDTITDVRVLIRYDIEDVSEDAYQKALITIFSEPPVDFVYEEAFPSKEGDTIFSVEFLPGQFDQRADSAEQCVKLLNEEENPVIRSATTYVISGTLTAEQIEGIKSLCINPVDSRENNNAKPETLVTVFEQPEDVKIFDGFCGYGEAELKELYDSLNLAMTFKDFEHIHNYFKNEEKRDPSVTEIRVLDTYWSDHCRHTTFQTELKDVTFTKGDYNEPMEASYKQYLADMGMTISKDPQNFYNNFPFMQNPNDPRYNYLYNNNTDWQDLIYKNTASTDHLFRVEGGDNIAKYDLSLGYYRENGLMDNTSMERFHTLLNANVLVNKQLNIFATVGLAYMNGHYQMQGMDITTNPILAAYARSPFLSPYEKDREGNTLKTYASHFYGRSKSRDYSVSNPLAIVNTLDSRNRQYDLNMKAGIAYNPFRELTLTGTVGLYYNYDNEHLFIPGASEATIVPLSDKYGLRNNAVSDGVAVTTNFFANLNASYKKTFNYVHQLNAIAGWQLMTTKNEYDAGEGRNTGNDFYQTLGSTIDGRRFLGYINSWNWTNFYGHADYTYNNMVQASVNIAVDAASSTGTDVARFYTYPSVGVTLLGKGWKPLLDATWLNKLNVRAEYGLTGNSRFSSQMGGYYYSTVPYMQLSTIVRSNIPNVSLKPEKNASLNLGLDLSVLNNRLNVSFDYYNNQISDMISAMPLSSVYGSVPYYANVGKLENTGIELSVQASLVRTRNFEWIVGGNITRSRDKIKSLGGEEQIVLSYDNGVQMVNRVGESPYQFYGYQADGVYSTQAEADAANLSNRTGRRYNAGDVRFVDQNGDNRIDDKDRILLGSAAPSYFGGFYTQLKYKGFALSAEFSYSKDNIAYNAVRQQLEAVSTTNNQSIAAVNRWTVEGQKTDMPKATWKDPVGNSYFSSRWMEDASYLRMKNVTLSYTFSKTLWNFFRSGTIYVTGENLLTFTDYLGMDPEFSYSYAENMQGFDNAKLMQPKTVKMGVNLKF